MRRPPELLNSPVARALVPAGLKLVSTLSRAWSFNNSLIKCKRRPVREQYPDGVESV
jgi:hypothetical protein